MAPVAFFVATIAYFHWTAMYLYCTHCHVLVLHPLPCTCTASTAMYLHETLGLAGLCRNWSEGVCLPQMIEYSSSNPSNSDLQSVAIWLVANPTKAHQGKMTTKMFECS